MIKLKFKKILRKGVKKCEYLSCEALSSDDLPEKYLSDTPNCYKLHNTLIINTSDNTVQMSPGSRYEPAYIKKLIDRIKECGKRLHEINQQLKIENAGWEGEETFCI